MSKNCNNCRWTKYGFYVFCPFSKERPKDDVCKYHNYNCCECNTDIAQYEYNGKKYCADCLVSSNGIESEEVTYYVYHLNGKYIGDDIDEVIGNLNIEFKEI